jgi:hypothetical protein
LATASVPEVYSPAPPPDTDALAIAIEPWASASAYQLSVWERVAVSVVSLFTVRPRP